MYEEVEVTEGGVRGEDRGRRRKEGAERRNEEKVE